MISEDRAIKLYEEDQDEDVKEHYDFMRCEWLERHKDGDKMAWGTDDKVVIKGIVQDRQKKLLNRINERVCEILTAGEKLALQQLPEHYKKVVELVDIPFEELHRPEVNVLIRDPQALEKYFRTIQYFSKDSETLKKELIKKDDFDAQKYQASNSRFILLNKLVNGVNMYECPETKKVLIKDTLDKDVAEKLQKEYSVTFRNRSKKLDFKDPQHVKTTIVRIYKLLFGETIIETQQTSTMIEETKSVMVDPDGHEVTGDKFVQGARSILVKTGKKKTKKVTNHYINHEYIELCNEIRKWKNNESKYSYECDTTDM
jgi:hypothetical protein